MSSRAKVVKTPFFRGNKMSYTCRSLRPTALSKFSSAAAGAAVIWRSMSVSGSVGNLMSQEITISD